MPNQALQRRTKERLPQVGVLAPTAGLATSLAQELGISRPMTFSPRSLTRARGVRLSALIVEDSCWPMPREVAAALIPCLQAEGGYVFHARRIDPIRKVS
jgi:hypothetical protein